MVLEGPAGCGKTTTLIQLAQRERSAGTPSWSTFRSGRHRAKEFSTILPGCLRSKPRASRPPTLHTYSKQNIPLVVERWNEIAESNSEQGNHALRELERDFPAAGIIVATRTHHLKAAAARCIAAAVDEPSARAARSYLEARLGTKSAELAARIDGDLPLDELTRTPFVLSEVVSLFEATPKSLHESLPS